MHIPVLSMQHNSKFLKININISIHLICLWLKFQCLLNFIWTFELNKKTFRSKEVFGVYPRDVYIPLILIMRWNPCIKRFCKSAHCQSDDEVSDDCPCSHCIGLSCCPWHSHVSKIPRASEAQAPPITTKNKSINVNDGNDIIRKTTNNIFYHCGGSKYSHWK